jgi:hypothetical protein
LHVRLNPSVGVVVYVRETGPAKLWTLVREIVTGAVAPTWRLTVDEADEI